MNPPRPRLAPRVTPVSDDYLDTVRALDALRKLHGLSQLRLESRARIAAGSWPKYLNPNARHGRIASEVTLAKVRAVLCAPPSHACERQASGESAIVR